MTKLTDKKEVQQLTLLCSAAYFTSYVSRINLGAVLVAVIDTGFASKETAALALTLCAVSYGLGQLVSGYLGDRYRPQNIILAGFFLTGMINFLVGFINNSSLLPLLWAVNGFAQSLMWPPLVAIMSGCFSTDDYRSACVRVNWGSSIGTIAVYLISPLVIKSLGLRFVFILSAAAAFIMMFIWKFNSAHFIMPSDISSKAPTPIYKNSYIKMDRTAYIVLMGVIICIMLQGFLRDSVTNWTPTYISEVFNLSSSVSILFGVILPLFAIISLQLTSYVYHRFLKNEMLCSGVIFALGTVSALILSLFSSCSIVLSLLCLAVLVGCMHGINFILTSMIPPHFIKYGKVSLVCGIVNSGVYVGSALSGQGTAIFSEFFGWKSTIFMWAIVALAGTGFCFLFRRIWSRFSKNAF